MAFGSAVAVESSTASAAAQSADPVVAPVSNVVGMIQILSGTHAGRTLELSKSLTTLGKPGTQVAVITRRPHGYFITHVEGVQRPVVTGQTIDDQARLLADQDVIEIAGIKIRKGRWGSDRDGSAL